MRSTLLLLAALALRGFIPSNSSAEDLNSFYFSRFAIPSPASSGVAPEPSIEEFSVGNDGIIKRGASAELYNPYSLLSDPSEGTGSGGELQTYLATTSRQTDNKRPCGPASIDPAGIEAMVIDAAGKYGVDVQFATAIAWMESRFGQIRNSPKGARGPMQLMPATAARFGVADICDPASNIDGGMRYLRTLLDQFKNPILAAAAYNAGEQSIYASGGVPAYPETVRYVAAVINRQLGVSFADKRLSNPRNRQRPENTDRQPARSDVIGARGATFVGGVMQF